MRQAHSPHPLTPDEIELYTRCGRTWCDSELGMDSVKTGVLSDELKQRLTCLAVIAGVSVSFDFDEGQHYIRAVRRKHP